jgi:hypothetical protein
LLLFFFSNIEKKAEAESIYKASTRRHYFVLPM